MVNTLSITCAELKEESLESLHSDRDKEYTHTHMVYTQIQTGENADAFIGIDGYTLSRQRNRSNTG